MRPGWFLRAGLVLPEVSSFGMSFSRDQYIAHFVEDEKRRPLCNPAAAFAPGIRWTAAIAHRVSLCEGCKKKLSEAARLARRA